MTHSIRPMLILTLCAFALSACVSNTGKPMQKTTEGAVVGGIIGGILGASGSGKKKKNKVLLGAAIGAAVGGLIGQELDRQEAALRGSLSNGDVGIVNTGSELVVTLPEAITFDTGNALVRDSLRGDLHILAANLNEFPDTTVDIIGHTDNVGAASFNQQLSSLRAENVFDIFANGGVATHRMRAIGRGENDPKASNLNEEGRAKNRRVEIVIRPIK